MLAEIKQSRPFASPEAEAALNLLRTADGIVRRVAETLRPYGLSPEQYNVLRILRGAGEEGLACREIGSRMVTQDPDITRLLDRLEARKLILRARERKDRRVVTTRIRPAGLRLLSKLERPLAALHRRLLGHLGVAALRRLIALLEAVRERPENAQQGRSAKEL
jgi:DNA-binding MarR family transcriptional regulator